MAMSDEEARKFNDLYEQGGYAQLFEEDLKLDLTPVNDIDVEIVAVKTLGSNERLEAKVKVPLKDARPAVVALYKNVIVPRSLSHVQETVEYQLKMDYMARKVKERDQAEVDAANGKNKKKGKK